MSYSCIIPVYRGAKTIGILFRNIKQVFDDQQLDFELIFIFDCGPDSSWQEICALKAAYPSLIQGIHLSRNFGQHNATICGFKYARKQFIITMDEDLQHDAQDIPRLIAKQKEGDYDLVYGKYEEKKHFFFRNFTSSLLNKLLQVGIPDLHKDYTSYRLVKTQIAKETLQLNNSYTFLDGYFSWITRNVTSVHVKHSEGMAGKSSYSLKMLLEHSINIFVTFSNVPIRLLSMFSFVILLCSFTYAFYILVRKLLYNDLVPGYASITVVLGIGFGFILFGMGVLGEYIQRINLKTTRRHIFLESKVI